MDERTELDAFLESLYLKDGPEGIVKSLSFLFGAFVITKNGIIIGANDVFLEIIQYERSTLCGLHAQQLLPDYERDRLADIFSSNSVEPYSLDILSSNGTIRHTQVSPKIFYVQSEVYRLAEFLDVTQIRIAERELKQSEDKFKAIFSHAAVGIARIALDGRWLEVNKRFCEILGYPETELKTLSYQQVTYPDDLELDTSLLMELLAGKRDSYTIEKRYFRKDGNIIWSRLSISLIKDAQGKPAYIAAFIEDISDLKNSEIEMRELNERLERYSYIDGLTLINNRRMLDLGIAKEWNRALRTSSSISFIMIDIDFFKNYNDHYGHLQGDECLKKIANAVNGVANRSSDLVARFGGEEFAILVPGASHNQAKKLAERCRKSIEQLRIPHEYTEVNDVKVVTVSIGVCTAVPNTNNSATELVEATDKRLYQAKHLGRNCVASD